MNLLKQREFLLALMVVILIGLVGLRAPIFLAPSSLANLVTDSTLLVMLALTQMLVIVMREGRIAAAYDNKGLDAETLVKTAAGIAA